MVFFKRKFRPKSVLKGTVSFIYSIDNIFREKNNIIIQTFIFEKMRAPNIIHTKEKIDTNLLYFFVFIFYFVFELKFEK